MILSKVKGRLTGCGRILIQRSCFYNFCSCVINNFQLLYLICTLLVFNISIYKDETCCLHKHVLITLPPLPPSPLPSTISGYMYYVCLLDMAVPALARFGSHELKEEFLAPSIAGDIVACLGVSEAGGGSDVASIKTTALPKG